MERLQLLPLDGRQRDASTYLATLKPGASQTAMRRALVRVAVLVARYPMKDGRPLGRIDLDRTPWRALDAERLAWLRDQLLATSSPATARQALSAVRGVLAGALDSAKRAATLVQAPKRRALPFVPTGHVRNDAIRALRSLKLTLPAILALPLEAWRAGATRVGKVRVPDALGDHLDRWLEHRGAEPGPLFCALTTRGRPIPDRPIDVRQLRKRLARRVTEPPPCVAV